MYQVNFTDADGVSQIDVDMYPNITSITGFLPSASPYSINILCRFIGVTTNWSRTGIAQAGSNTRNNRYWRIKFSLFSSSLSGVLDVESARRNGQVFLPSQEIYNVEFYHQTSTTNLDVASATKIDWQTQINVDRQTDDPYNQAPVSSFTQYTDNDLTSVANTNVEYGTQTA